jgi:cystathionine gamma-synthase
VVTHQPASDGHASPHTRLRPETLAVTAGRPARVVGGPLNQPVVFASTYIGSRDPADAELGYGRDGNPTWQALEDALGALEGGRAVTFASGMAATNAVLEQLPPGAVLVLPRHCYLGVSNVVDQRAARLGWTVRRVDVADTAQVLDAADGADLVWIESPTNPAMEICDLPELGGRLAGSSARLVVDNTFATPLLQRPLESGAHLVLHAATKMISGHSDVLLGAVVTRTSDEGTFLALQAARRDFGGIPGPMEAYLALRGLRTLPLRLAQAQASAQLLAERLAGHPRVGRVRFPGLPTDPGHAVARRTMAGFGSIISVELTDAATADAFVEGCSLWVFATSLGGVESTLERRRRWPGELPSIPEGLVRLSVGIEHVEDLWQDLSQALDALG